MFREEADRRDFRDRIPCCPSISGRRQRHSSQNSYKRVTKLIKASNQKALEMTGNLTRLTHHCC